MHNMMAENGDVSHEFDKRGLDAESCLDVDTSDARASWQATTPRHLTLSDQCMCSSACLLHLNMALHLHKVRLASVPFARSTAWAMAYASARLVRGIDT